MRYQDRNEEDRRRVNALLRAAAALGAMSPEAAAATEFHSELPTIKTLIAGTELPPAPPRVEVPNPNAGTW